MIRRERTQDGHERQRVKSLADKEFGINRNDTVRGDPASSDAPKSLEIGYAKIAGPAHRARNT